MAKVEKWGVGLSQLSQESCIFAGEIEKLKCKELTGRSIAENMEKIWMDVVALSHNDLRTYYKEYAREAVGRELVLQPQPENVKDPYAVKVREGNVHVGYVSVPDLDLVYGALAGSGKKRLRGKVVEAFPDPPLLKVEVAVERMDWAYEPYDNKVYEGWRYDGISLMPRKLEQLADLVADLEDGLESGEMGVDELLKGVKALLKTNLYDASREMSRSRHKLERLLASHEDKRLRDAAVKLRQQKGMLMRHEVRDEVARYLFVQLPEELQGKGLEGSHYTYDNRLDELEVQLRAFPFQLYDKFLSDPVDFLREVYYNHVPRRVLFPLLSGIVLMILKGRVSIARWGREGDTKPIKEMHLIGHPKERYEQGDEDDEDEGDERVLSKREKIILECIKEVLEKRNAKGVLIVKNKNQWAGMMGVLANEYGFPNDMRAFCALMAKWGFGKDSGYEVFCDYANLSKSSYYAQNKYSEWKGKGAAFKQQRRAAAELRGLLRGKGLYS